MSALERVRALAELRDDLELRLAEAVVLARQEGATAVAIAEAAGVDRATLYRRWLTTEGHGDEGQSRAAGGRRAKRAHP